MLYLSMLLLRICKLLFPYKVDVFYYYAIDYLGFTAKFKNFESLGVMALAL